MLKKYNLDINHLFTHTHWLQCQGRKIRYCGLSQYCRNPYKMCPLYILPHWSAFKSKVQSYMKSGTSVSKNPTTKLLYRVRKSWSDAKSQIGAFSSLDNAKRHVNQDIMCLMQTAMLSIQPKSPLTKLPVKSFRVNGVMALTAKRLTNAGYDYNAVQKRVNELMK